MYPLVLCSLLALGVMIAEAITLLAAHRRSRAILQQVGELGAEGQLDKAIELATETPGPVAAILLSGLRRAREAKVSGAEDRKSTRLNSSHVAISYAVFCLKKKN